MRDVGATVMGRNMFGGGAGPWGDDPWNGWWGDDPPFHHPVFVLTHHAAPAARAARAARRSPSSPTASRRRSPGRRAAAGKDVSLAGGADVRPQQYLGADLVDEMEIDLVPMFLGDGERLFDGLGVGRPRARQTVAAPASRT